MTRAGFEKRFRLFDVTETGGKGATGKEVEYTVTKKLDKLPARPRKSKVFAGLPLPVLVSEGQEINPQKEEKRQMKKLGKKEFYRILNEKKPQKA